MPGSLPGFRGDMDVDQNSLLSPTSAARPPRPGKPGKPNAPLRNNSSSPKSSSSSPGSAAAGPGSTAAAPGSTAAALEPQHPPDTETKVYFPAPGL
ncbi:hypothetical protein GWK47_051542 [Chionoecetes opilio]|uniref:Uncharacterized protein n=1 Tax=Chionoecetes opilio TaxID=41210 RepID=A0A8J4Y276_CHIOP|nr:hypothetical protein GWK47_051542 [Chionoecetes opilio]